MLHSSPCDSRSYADELLRERTVDSLTIDAYRKMGTVVSAYFAPEFTKILAYALRDGWEEAEIICNSLGLEAKHMACLINDDEWLDECTQPDFDEGDFSD